MPKTNFATGRAHVWPIRVYYEDTDAGGVVYYANYLKFAERARTEMLRGDGVDHPTLASQYGVQVVVKSCMVDFIGPARLDDALEVRSSVATLGGASFTLRQEIFRGDTLLVTTDVRLACVDMTMRPARLPKMLQQILASRDSLRDTDRDHRKATER
jgi:acyl-CoA thioester hydrolase